MEGNFTPGSVYVVNKTTDKNHGRAVRIKERDGNLIIVSTASKNADGSTEILKYTESELVFLQHDTRR